MANGRSDRKHPETVPWRAIASANPEMSYSQIRWNAARNFSGDLLRPAVFRRLIGWTISASGLNSVGEHARNSLRQQFDELKSTSQPRTERPAFHREDAEEAFVNSP